MNRKELRKYNLRWLKREKNTSWSDMAELLSIDQNYLSNIAREGSTRGVSKDLAESIEKLYELSPGWFDQDHDKSMVSEIANVYEISKYKEKIINIPIYETNYAMGNGAHNFDHDVIVSSLKVTQKFIRENISIQTTPDNLAIATGLGDSMQPTFNDQDQLFMDTGVKIAEIDAIYAFDYLGDFYIKRLQRIPGNGILAISDNDKYKPFSIEAEKDFFIHGQIVGIWNFKRV